MPVVLGIDTGGTYTDGVIIDLENKEVLAATKAETTHDNLIVGIRKAIEQLAYDNLEAIEYVALSTTLATNAIVENRGCRVGLLMLGFTPEKDLPACRYEVLPGIINGRGLETEPLDLEKTRRAIESLRGKIDAMAVSGIFSVHNATHEETVKGMIREILGLPVVAAHELTTALGIQERTVTAVLNARLISVIEELMNAVKAALSERGLEVPIMIVKGDGSLMSESIARERPIETILSGPAASIIGSTYLEDLADGLVLDMGGTTTDIAVLSAGRPRLDNEGARVGGWRTRVNAAEANTFGLGGDSRISYDRAKKCTTVGPSRCWPLAVICRDYPAYLAELKYISVLRTGMVSNDLAEGYFLLREVPSHMNLTERQERIIEVLRDGPHTIVYIARKLDTSPNFLQVESLVEHGILGMIGFTPTDVLHVTGAYVVGSVEAAKLGAAFMAKSRGTSVTGFIELVQRAVTDKLCRTILDSAMAYQGFALTTRDDKTQETFFDHAIWQKNQGILSVQYRLNMPIIGIGAPVKAWLPAVAAKFDAELCFPKYNHVANAVGAAAGKVMTIYRLKTQNHDLGDIGIFAPWGKIPFAVETDVEIDDTAAVDNIAQNEIIECAVQKSISEGKKRIVAEMERQGVKDYDILVNRRDITSGSGYDESVRIHIETLVDVIATGRPHWS